MNLVSRATKFTSLYLLLLCGPSYGLHVRSIARQNGLSNKVHQCSPVGEAGTLAIPMTRKRSLPKSQGATKRQIVVQVISLISILATASPAFASSNAALPAKIGTRQLVIAASLVMLTGSISLTVFWGVKDVALSLLKACMRCTLQLYLAGGFLLTQVMSTTNPTFVGAWIALTGLIAAQEASSRVEYTYPSLQRHLAVSLLGGAGLVLSFAGLARLFIVDPWFAPRTWIPVAGMLFGNTLTAMSLTAATLTKELVEKKDQVETRLCRGATWQEATKAPMKQTMLTALTPIINALSVTGVVHIPGMMTGQILSGQAPYQAAAYQVLIFFLIASTTCSTVQLLARQMFRQMVDKKNHRLSLDKLQPSKKRQGAPSTTRSLVALGKGIPKLFKRVSKYTHTSLSKNTNAPIEYVVDGTDDTRQSVDLIFTARNIRVPRANVDFSAAIHDGECVGLSGISGSGKSQILRSLVGLEDVDRSRLSVNGKVASDMDMPEWRTHISLVPQNPISPEGTPRDSFREVIAYDSYEGADKQRFESEYETFVTEWGLQTTILDQPWSTLSGGEAQRCRLALALCLKPKVLLLDESTSALDEETTKTVETTLKRLGMSILMISHSSSQLQRFCSRTISIPSEPIKVDR